MLKPVLFNTAMVQAILDGRKTVTRRGIKRDFHKVYKAACVNGKWNEDFGQNIPDSLFEWYAKEIARRSYDVGDILWVRETWRIQSAHRFDANVKIEFKAGGPMQTIQFANSGSQSINRDDYDAFVNKWWNDDGKWHPSIHMPREAARLFLKVTDVWVERLRDIMKDPPGPDNQIIKEGQKYGCDFIATWNNNAIKKKVFELYGWDANPWVFVYEFERCENAV